MKLSNFTKIVDENINIIITGIRPDREKIGYDFDNDEWHDCNKMTRERIIPLKEFISSSLYRLISSTDVNFSVFNNRHISTLKDFVLYKDTVVVIEVFLIPEKFPFVKEFTQKNKNSKHGFTEVKCRDKFGTRTIHYDNSKRNSGPSAC